MNVIKALIVLSLVGGGLASWKHHRASHRDAAALSGGTPGSFVSLPPVDGQRAQAVFVIAAQNCPHDAAQRADHLAEALARQGIPVERTNQAHFRFTSQPDAATLERMGAVMNGTLPVVFVNGRAKSNPSLDEVAAEFRQAAR